MSVIDKADEVKETLADKIRSIPVGNAIRNYGVNGIVAAAGVGMAYEALTQKPPRDQRITERLRRYGQAVLGVGLVLGSALEAAYRSNLGGLQDRFEVGMPYIKRKTNG